MARKSDRKALGRGLSALLGDTNAPLPAGAAAPVPQATNEVAIDLIRANPNQPRKNFKKEDLEELAGSIRSHGVIIPVLLRPDPDDTKRYQIVAGERRWRAAQMAGVHSLPAVVQDLDDKATLELAIIENVQRVDLDPVEEAQGYTQLIETFDYTQEELSNAIGKSRSHVTNILRLLTLPDKVVDMIRQGSLSPGHARALMKAEAPVSLAERAVNEGLSVRQVELLAREDPVERQITPTPPARKSTKDPDTRQLEGDLTAAIGMRVTIDHRADGQGGQLSIRYRTLDDLDEICRKLAE
ncbi:MAG: ParB/RepB/Spo0J family partition protein [Pseudomonadota bacterium]